MTQIALTPVERGVLIVLMAQGEPTTQADFKNRHGFEVKKNHRLKLAEAGLIEVAGKTQYTFTLTKDGWEWLSQELTAPPPEGSKGLGPLYAALGAINRLVKRLGLPVEEALKAGETPAHSDIREPEWIEADESLARALQDIPVFTRALNRLRNSGGAGLKDEIDQAELSADLVFQHIKLASKKRALALEGQVGEEVAYDPVHFSSHDDVNLGDRVRVRKPMVTRGQGKQKIIVQLGLADAL
jgi:hypothetical protein